jgi:hypothetical protein
MLAFTRRSSEETIIDPVNDKNDYAWIHYRITGCTSQAAGHKEHHTRHTVIR